MSDRKTNDIANQRIATQSKTTANYMEIFSVIKFVIKFSLYYIFSVYS